MSMEHRCTGITSTKSGKLEAGIEFRDEDAFRIVSIKGKATRESPYVHNIEVTIGDERWKALPRELREVIITRARRYTNRLIDQLNECAPPIHIRNEV